MSVNNRQVVIPEAEQWFIAQHRKPSDVMYHYTASREALQNIILTRRMWATDLRAMNDPRELRYGKEMIDQRIKSAVRRSRNSLKELFLRSMQKQFHTLITDRSSSFSISFSEHPALANQWRDYAAQGCGFVLGWSIDSVCPGAPLRMWVTYDRGRQKDLVDGLIKFHLDWILDSVSRDGNQPDEAFANAGLSLGMLLNVVLQTFKSKGWAQESEFRYVFQFFQGYDPPGSVFKIRFVEGVEKRYIEVDFTQVELRRVIIGPCNDISSSSRWLRQLLDENGFENTTVVPPVVSLDEVTG